MCRIARGHDYPIHQRPFHNITSRYTPTIQFDMGHNVGGALSTRACRSAFSRPCSIRRRIPFGDQCVFSKCLPARTRADASTRNCVGFGNGSGARAGLAMAMPLAPPWTHSRILIHGSRISKRTWTI